MRDRLADAIADVVIRMAKIGDPADVDATIALAFKAVHAQRARAGSGRYHLPVHDDPVMGDDERPTDPAPPCLEPTRLVSVPPDRKPTTRVSSYDVLRLEREIAKRRKKSE